MNKTEQILGIEKNVKKQMIAMGKGKIAFKEGALTLETKDIPPYYSEGNPGVHKRGFVLDNVDEKTILDIQKRIVFNPNDGTIDIFDETREVLTNYDKPMIQITAEGIVAIIRMAHRHVDDLNSRSEVDQIFAETGIHDQVEKEDYIFGDIDFESYIF